MKGKVVRSLKAGDMGTKRLVEKYGARLICVRYRVDEEARRRYITVELTEQSRELRSPDQTGEIADIEEVPILQDVGAETGAQASEAADRSLANARGEERGERMFWFRFRGYLPELYRSLKRAGVRRGPERGVWGLPWSDAEALGLLENPDVEYVQI